MNPIPFALALLLGVLSPARVATADPPRFVQNPRSLMVAAGETLRLSSLASGAPPLAYIWQRDTTFLSGQTNADLVISNAQPADSGHYAAIATNQEGADRSQVADVIVYTNQPCNFPWTWQARFRGPDGDPVSGYVLGLGLDSKGNTLVTGPAAPVGSSLSWLTAKFDTNGVLLWSQSHRRDEPTSQSQYATALAVDSEDACYVTGYTYGVKSPSEGDNDYLTIKYDAAGQAAWTNRWDGNPVGRSDDIPYSIAVDAHGESYILGTTALLKLSANGEAVWSNRSCRGGLATGMRLFGDSVYGPTENAEVFRVNTNGTLIWLKDLGADRRLAGISMDSSGCTYAAATARYNFATSTGDIEVSKFDPDGANLWTTVYDGPFGRLDSVRGIAVDPQGSAYVTGWTWNTNRIPENVYDTRPGDALTLKLNPDGTLAWATTYRSPEDLTEGGLQLALDDEGGVYVAAHASIRSPQVSEGIPILLKYDPLGNLLWTSVYREHPRETEGSVLSLLALGREGQIVVAGRSTHQLSGENWMIFLIVGYNDRTPRLTMAGAPAPGVRQGCLVSPRWSVFDLLAATNLTGGDWMSLGAVTNYNGLTPFFDRDAGKYPLRFYRTREQQR